MRRVATVIVVALAVKVVGHGVCLLGCCGLAHVGSERGVLAVGLVLASLACGG